MRKIISLILICALCVAVFAGCTRRKDKTENTTRATTNSTESTAPTTTNALEDAVEEGKDAIEDGLEAGKDAVEDALDMTEETTHATTNNK